MSENRILLQSQSVSRLSISVSESGKKRAAKKKERRACARLMDVTRNTDRPPYIYRGEINTPLFLSPSVCLSPLSSVTPDDTLRYSYPPTNQIPKDKGTDRASKVIRADEIIDPVLITDERAFTSSVLCFSATTSPPPLQIHVSCNPFCPLAFQSAAKVDPGLAKTHRGVNKRK